MTKVENDLEKAESKAEFEETQVSGLEEELKIVVRNSKSLEESEKKAVSREEAQRMKMKQLMEDLKKAEEKVQFAEQSVHRVQVEVWKLNHSQFNCLKILLRLKFYTFCIISRLINWRMKPSWK